MRFPAMVLTLLMLLGSASWNSAGDLSKIERRVAKEPTYQSGAPQYCLLLFGPHAQTRIWVVVDGDLIYVDRNGNGDLTEAAERFERKGRYGIKIDEIVEADGKTRHKDLMVLHSDKFMTAVSVLVGGACRQSASYDTEGNLRFAGRPQDAPIIHFNGPLTLGRFDSKVLARGESASDLTVLIGTPGVGNGTFAAIEYRAVPENVHPVAEVEFPGNAPGAATVLKRVTLGKRC